MAGKDQVEDLQVIKNFDHRHLCNLFGNHWRSFTRQCRRGQRKLSQNYLFGKQVGPFREASVQQSGKKAFAIRKGKWKLIVHGDNKRELFDLNLDLGETNNIIRTHPQVALRSWPHCCKATLTEDDPLQCIEAQPLEYKISLDEIRFKKK